MPEERGFKADGPVRWLSTDAAAEAIGMSRWFVRDRIEAGDLPARAWRSGDRIIYRVRSDHLDVFMRAWSFDPLSARSQHRGGDGTHPDADR
jgi:hypothetical protein